MPQKSFFDSQTEKIEIIGEIDSATGKILYYDKVTETIDVDINPLNNPEPIKSHKVPSQPLPRANIDKFNPSIT